MITEHLFRTKEECFLINVHIVHLLVCGQDHHTLVTSAKGEHSLIKTSQGVHTVSEDYLCSSVIIISN